jgi:hypothetical protein
MTTLGRVWLIGLALGLSASLAWAQLYSGSVVGVVTDPSNAVIPGTKVSLVDEEKGFTFNAETDASGRYLFRGVPPGLYKVSATAQGFQTQTRTGIKIDVNQNASVDFALQLTTGAQAVSVTTEAAQLSTEDAATGQVLTRKFINDLPNINRSVMDLVYLTPGIVSANNGRHSGDPVNFVANGSRNATSDVLMDGTSITNYEQNSGTLVAAYTPSPDAVEEFKVQTSNFSAEFGFSSSTVVNMVTRSGSNEFHGSGYEYLRNQKLDANRFFDNAAGNPLPGLRRNNFGGTVGGPIKKNKTFFFFDYDGTREVTQSSGATAVPTATERTGNFGELCGYNGGSFDANGRCSADAGQLWDPYVATYDPDLGGAVRTQYIPFNNMITYMSPGNPKLNGTGYQAVPHPGNLIDPVAFKLMQYFPMPNFNVGTASYDPTLNWRGSGPNTSTNNQYDIKIDHRFSDKSLLSAKWSQQSGNSHSWNQYGNIADPNTGGKNPGTAHAFAINENYTFSPTLLLTVSYGWSRNWGFTKGIISDYPKLDPVTLLGMPQYMDISGVLALPNIVINDSYGSQLGGQPWSYYLSGIDTHQLQGTMSWVKGAHELKFGAEGRLHRINSANPGPTGGQFNYDLTTTSQNPNYDDTSGGDAFASFLTGFGTPNGGGEYEVANWVSTQNFQYSGYVQDNWKISRKLTLNLGLRYDVTLPRTERYNRMESVDPNVVSPLVVPGLGTLHGGEVFASPSDRTVYNIDATNFQPRFGFAWQPLSKTVVRGGYGIFYSTTKAGAAGPGAWGYQGYVKDTPWITTYQNDGATPWGRLSDPWPGTGPSIPPGNALGLLNDTGGDSAWGPVKGINKTPYEQTWSFGIQRELPWNVLLDTTYVGKKGTHLYFGNAGDLNVLGSWVQGLSSSQVGALKEQVPNPFYGIITDPNKSLSSPTVQAYQLLRPFPQFDLVGGDGPPYANSSYHAAQFRLEKRFSSGLQFLATYVFSKALDDSSATDGNIDWRADGKGHLQNPNNFALEKAISPYDSTHVFQFSHVYELPFGKGKPIGGNWNSVVNGFLGGWQFNGIWSLISGRPMTLALNGGHSLPTYGDQGPNLIGTPQKASSDLIDQYFANPDVFVKPDRYAISNAPRTLPWVRKPGQTNATLSLFKEFALSKIHEGMRLEYRVEALNAFNHVQFSGPKTTVGNSNFGQITSQANLPREVQMALKLYF